jgi:hypothetical protein
MGALAAAKISALIHYDKIISLRSDSTQIIVAINSASFPFLICSPMRQGGEILRANVNILYMSGTPTSSLRLTWKRHS